MQRAKARFKDLKKRRYHDYGVIEASSVFQAGWSDSMYYVFLIFLFISDAHLKSSSKFTYLSGLGAVLTPSPEFASLSLEVLSGGPSCLFCCAQKSCAVNETYLENDYSKEYLLNFCINSFVRTQHEPRAF